MASATDTIISLTGSFDARQSLIKDKNKFTTKLGSEKIFNFISASNPILDYKLFQELEITPFDGALGDDFGFSVAIGQNRIVIGAPGQDLNGASSGAIYIYDYNQNLISKIGAAGGTDSDFYGFSVAVGCNRIVVGAPFTNDSGTNSGATFIYDLDGNLIKKVIPQDGGISHNFGISVSIGCGRIVVGSRGATNQSSLTAGAAYIYDLDGNFFSRISQFNTFGPPEASGDFFGQSVSIGSGRIVVGAYGRDDNGTNSGAAYIYDIDGFPIQKITPSDGGANDQFGFSVSVGSGRIIVGAIGDNGTSGYINSGSAYVFDLNGTEIQKLTVPFTSNFNYNSGKFGNSVIAASYGFLCGAPQANYTNNVPAQSNAGSCIIFCDYNDPISLNENVSTINRQSGEEFGTSIAVSGLRFVVGKPKNSGIGSVILGKVYIGDVFTQPDGTKIILDGESGNISQCHYLDQLDGNK